MTKEKHWSESELEIDEFDEDFEEEPEGQLIEIDDEDLEDDEEAESELDYELIGATLAQTASTETLPSEMHYTVTKPEVGERVDKLVSDMRPDLSRAHVQRLIEERNLTVNERSTKSGYKLRIGDKLFLKVPPPSPLTHLAPEDIPLDIVYEDADIIVVNKPAGLVVHPAPGHYTGTLVNALLNHVPDMNINGNVRPGIVHRLDKDTSGLLVVAKTDAALQSLIGQMKARTTLKEYIALVEGNIQPPAGIIDAPIGRDPAARKHMAVVRNGKTAQTEYKVLKYLTLHSLVQARILTGRTHQIRVHFAYLSYPVAGDMVYGRRKPTIPLKRQFLHAARLGLQLPSTGEYREFEAPLPPELKRALEAAEKIE